VSRPAIIFSVDVEDWGQSVFDQGLPIGESCADNVRRLLALIGSDSEARGTFFVLGKFAQKHPDVVREIAAAGHEIASHGFGHVPIQRLDRRTFREDVRRASAILSGITGRPVVGYRAPEFSIVGSTLWALEVLSEEAFEFDSSIFPFRGRRYGVADWPAEARVVRLDGGRLIAEYPLTTLAFGRRRLPVSGGGYARLLPCSWLVRSFTWAAERRTDWPVFYCHPYELDADEFTRRWPSPTWATRRVPWRLRVHQGIGRRGFTGKLKAILERFSCRSFAQARAILWAPPQYCLRESASANGHQTSVKRTPCRQAAPASG